MFLLLPFLLGAGSTGYWWWSSQEQKEPSLIQELFDLLKPILLVLLVLLFFRWLYAQSTPATPAPSA